MTDLALDTTLDVILLIFAALLLIIPLIKDIRKTIQVKDKKHKVISTHKGGLSGSGIFFIVIFGLSLACGIWKAIRDDKAKNDEHSQNTTLSIQMNDVVHKLNNDSAKIYKIYQGLTSRGLSLDSNFNIINGISGLTLYNIYASNFGGDFIHIEQPPKK